MYVRLKCSQKRVGATTTTTAIRAALTEQKLTPMRWTTSDVLYVEHPTLYNAPSFLGLLYTYMPTPPSCCVLKAKAVQSMSLLFESACKPCSLYSFRYCWAFLA